MIHRCLEKNPEQRFQSAADLAFALGALSEPGFSSSAAVDATGPRKKRSVLAWSPVGLLVVALALGAYFVLSRRSSFAPVRIVEYKQLTHDGHAGQVLATDGNKLFLQKGPPLPIGQVAVAGGEVVPLATNVAAPWLDDISPDGSTLLIESYEQGAPPTRPLYSVPVLGGSRRFLANVAGAKYTPDGNNIIYGLFDGNTYLMRSDGSDPQKIASMETSRCLVWSPDGTRISFTKADEDQLWEMSSSFTNAHPLLPGWRTDHDQLCGRWSPDGKLFFFLSGPGPQLWVRDERKSLFRPMGSQPVQLTSGPISWGYPTLAKDGKTIFASGSTSRGELVRFNSKSNQPQLFLGGISAHQVSFSKDGRSVAYVSFPDGVLWKANSDGSDPMQLTNPLLTVISVAWSPDGTQIAFTGYLRGPVDSAYIVSSQGGVAQRLLPEDKEEEHNPTWSPDGTKIIFDTAPLDNSKSDIRIRIVDVSSRQVTNLPGSNSMVSAGWSPDGRFIMTEARDITKIYLLDVKSQQWSTLYRGFCAHPLWSKDSHSVLFLAGKPGILRPIILRIPITGGQPQVVADLKDFHYTTNLGVWMGLDPTDAPLMLRDVGTTDIYALRLEEH